jgi:tight adherence protein C
MVLPGLSLWLGLTLVLSRISWFARRPLADRLRPYAAGGLTRPLPDPGLAELVGPIASEMGRRLSAVFGVGDDVAHRLARIHSPVSPTDFRVRQMGVAVASAAAAALTALALAFPTGLGVATVIGAGLLGFLVVEQGLVRQSERWQSRLLHELPVVSEQLAMLLGAGYSLTSALRRLAARGQGACARDLRRVVARIDHGVGEVTALREWAELARVDALDRLLPVISLNRESGDLAALLSAEARSIRRDVHRRMVETMERRSQQVWVPVTVATLVPGVIFLSIPFIEALSLFSGS